MPKSKNRPSNRHRVRLPGRSRVSRPEPKGAYERIVSLACEIQDSLDAVLSLGGAIELMVFGMRNLGDDYSTAFLTVGESVTSHLKAAKKTCSQIVIESEDLTRKGT